MMCLSQTAGYAIHALSIVAHGGGQLCLIREIARLSGIPKPYLAKIINQLSREGLVSAKRGYRGGIYLTRPPREISLLEIVEAIEGKDFIAECMLGLTGCSSPCFCPTHDVWGRLRDEIRQALQKSTLANVLKAMNGQSATAAVQKAVLANVASGRQKKKFIPRAKRRCAQSEYSEAAAERARLTRRVIS